MAQFFDFLYHSENKSQSIKYGNKIIKLYKDKAYISRAIIFIKLSLYEYYLKNQKENLAEYDLNEHVNNISELITMFGKCEIENKNSEILSQIINRLSTDKRYYEEVANKCEKRAQEYDVNMMVESYMDVYRKVI